MTAGSSAPRRATLRMVAEAAGVSTATASYVLSGRSGGASGVSPRTTARVQRAAEKLDYRPDPTARAMRTGRTDQVLLSLTMLADPWAQEVADATAAALRPHRITTLTMADSDWFPILERQASDAVFLDHAENDPATRERLRTLVARGHRLVVFSDTLEPDGFDVVRSRAEPDSREAVEHLLRHHTRIGCLRREGPVRRQSSRFGAYRDALDAAGIRYRSGDVATFGPSQLSAFAAAARLLDRPDPPTAIYATTDFAAIAAIHAAQHLGLRVPDDLAVVGVGNTIEGEQMTPSLTSLGPEDFFPRLAEAIRLRAVGERTGPGVLIEFPWRLHRRDSG